MHNNLVARRPTDFLFRVKLDKFARAKRLIETFSDLLSEVAEAFSVDLMGGDVKLSPHSPTVTLRRKVGGHSVRAELSGVTLLWSIKKCEAIAVSLNALTAQAPCVSAVIPGIAHLILAFLPVEPRLVADVLSLLLRINAEFGFEIVGSAMESSRIKNTGRPSMCFQSDPPFTVEFPSPYASTGQLTVTRASGVEKLRGMGPILSLLRGS
jgi:hypothetical protein